ncbi:rhodanese-like domain-containing protein [Pseudomonas mangiferae]|uniref:Rhodanese-like domain-containing protein n=1 Tax=Pseudomonas mangiferae TaxID=2593654 RepID=A0A553GY16_9PSED|nr:rhodanese-like domain-containing protein [Pseudomonas mangiferae]TRX74391.1 rhodanese-like domain-containing protein [Pseudomonas mangiferae]
MSLVSQFPAASPERAEAHFAARLAFETDCSDVHACLEAGTQDFVLADVRATAFYAQGHVPGAISLPQRDLDAEHLAAYPPSTLFVVYCAGPHCNGAQRAALKLARLGFPVKEMLGGITGWLDEGFALHQTAATERPAAACGC